jgi:hypothetical protein
MPRGGGVQWVSRELPYWNRTGGRDHLTTFAFDEGACFAPQVGGMTLLGFRTP